MSLCTLNNAAVLRLDAMIPLWGAWTADVQLDGSTAPAVGSPVTLTIVNTSRVGTVVRSGAPYEQPRCRVVGGAGKLSQVLSDARDYGQVALSKIARDILTDVSERPRNLSQLSAIVQRYQVAQERASVALQRLFKLDIGLELWCEHDGSFSAREAPFVHTETALTRGVLPQEKLAVLFGDSGAIEPGIIVGTIYGDFYAERVQYELDPMDSRAQLTTRVWYK